MAAGVHPVAVTVRSRASKCSNSLPRSLGWAGTCLTLAVSLASVTAYESDPRFIFISSPTKRTIYYSPLPASAELSKYSNDRAVQTASVLIDGNVGTEETTTTAATSDATTTAAAETTVAPAAADFLQLSKRQRSQRSQRRLQADGESDTDADTTDGATAETTAPEEPVGSLLEPAGLAIWHGKDEAVLYVADTKQHKIFSYQITGTFALNPDDPTNLGSAQAGTQVLVAKDINTVSGLALDGFGNLYYSTKEGKVGYLASSELHPLGTPVANVLYATDSQKTVQAPITLAADNFNVYWGNQANGQQEGVLVSAFERNVEALAEKYPDYPKALAKNAEKASGVCVARNNVFFTGEAQFLYGVKTVGGSVTEVYSGFKAPKGCAYDGEGTLYVADETAGAVYSLPANFPTLRPVGNVAKVAIVDTPTSIAVFTSAKAYEYSAGKSWLWR